MRNLRNSVSLIGHVGKEPEIIKFDNGNQLAKFSLATTESFKNKKGEKSSQTHWHNLVVWGKLSQVVAKYVSKGKQICIEGRLSSRAWEDQQGQKHYATEILVHDILLLGKAKSA